MTSVDSGVETGNDSNDSSMAQHENQHATTIASPVATAANVVAATAGQVAVDEVAPMTITDTHESNESCVPCDPSHLMTLRPYWPADTALLSIRDYKFNDFKQAPLTTHHDLDRKLHEKHIFPLRGNHRRNISFKTHYDKIHCDDTMCRRRRIESRIRSANEYRLLLHDKESATLGATVAQLIHKSDLKWDSLNTEWRIVLQKRKMRVAAATNDIDTVKRLLRNNISPNNHDIEGRTPLHHAACRGYSDMVRLLLEHGADPNQRDRIGNTPLHLAAVTSKISVVTLLLAAGTDVRSIDQYGFNPLHLAQAKLKMLQNYKYGATNIKEEMHNIVKMLMTYLNKQKNMNEQIETLINFCSRLSLSTTSDQVQDDVKDLLANIETLDITS